MTSYSVKIAVFKIEETYDGVKTEVLSLNSLLVLP